MVTKGIKNQSHRDDCHNKNNQRAHLTWDNENDDDNNGDGKEKGHKLSYILWKNIQEEHEKC